MDVLPRDDQQSMDLDETATAIQQQAGALLAELAMMRRHGLYCDVLLQGRGAVIEQANAEPQAVRAHRAVLASASTYFYKMFYRTVDNCTTETIYLKDIDTEKLTTLIEHIYSPELLPISIVEAKATLAVAKQLNVDDVRDMACAFLARSLAAENVLGIREFAELHACSVLAAAATKYTHDHFEQVLKGKELLELSFDSLRAMLDSAHVEVDETWVLDAVLLWTEHRPQDRRQWLSSLLQAVRLEIVPRETLSQRASVEPLSSNSHALLQIIKALGSDHARLKRSAQTAAMEVPSELNQVETPPTKPKRRALDVQGDELLQLDEKSDSLQAIPCIQSGWQLPATLFVMGGQTNQVCATDSVVFCSVTGGQWQAAAPLPANRQSAGAVLLAGSVYFIGGDDGEASVETVFEYDAATSSWSVRKKMMSARSGLGVTTFAGRVYAMGGWDGHRELDSVEALDPREGVWRSVASMIVPRRKLGVAILGERLYAVGGVENRGLDNVERYDPAADKWEVVEPMSKHRTELGVAVVDNELYAVGGLYGWTKLRTVERYRAGSGWRCAPSMKSLRYNAAVTAHDSRLYVIGGQVDETFKLDEVSIFDPEIAIWSELPALTRNGNPAPRTRGSAVVVPWTPAQV